MTSMAFLEEQNSETCVSSAVREKCFNKKDDVSKIPLKCYDDGKRDLSEMVLAKWVDANSQILEEYNQKVRAVLGDARSDVSVSAQNLQSCKLKELSHKYISDRERLSLDFLRQSRLAKLYVRRLRQSMPRLKYASYIIRNLFFISGIAGSVLAIGHGKEGAVKGSVALLCLSAVAVLTVFAEERRIHHQSIRIKSHLLSWHKMSSQNKDSFYNEIMSPVNMGLCGFIETFYKTR